MKKRILLFAVIFFLISLSNANAQISVSIDQPYEGYTTYYYPGEYHSAQVHVEGSVTTLSCDNLVWGDVYLILNGVKGEKLTSVTKQYISTFGTISISYFLYNLQPGSYTVALQAEFWHQGKVYAENGYPELAGLTEQQCNALPADRNARWDSSKGACYYQIDRTDIVVSPTRTFKIVYPPQLDVSVRANGADAIRVNSNEKYTLSYAWYNAEYCWGSGEWNGLTSSQASYSSQETYSKAQPGTYTYTIACRNNRLADTKSSSASVEVVGGCGDGICADKEQYGQALWCPQDCS